MAAGGRRGEEGGEGGSLECQEMRSMVIGIMEKAWLEEGESSGGCGRGRGWSGDVASGRVRTRLGDKTTNQEPVIHRPLLFAWVSRMAVPPDLRNITVGA